MLNKYFLNISFLGLAALGFSQSATLRLEIGSSPNLEQIDRTIDREARQFGQVAAEITRHAREVRHLTRSSGSKFQFSLPSRLVLTSSGRELGPVPQSRLLSNTLTLAFDSSGSRIFAPAYQALLQSVFDTAVPTINAVFGQPSVSGTVHIRNYDADIGDRDAVAGGVYVPNNGSGQAEIRFPVYNSDEAAAVNFIHTVLLAYLGADSYSFDAFEEGLTRASVLKICRSAGALPVSLDAAQVEAVLESTYDVGRFYDWYNQRALGGPVFIAPNLKTGQLPLGGSLGGIYLLRFQMSGSAWQKVLVEYPAFASALNSQLYASPSLGSDISSLVVAAQAAMDNLGGPSSTIEGLSFAEWYRRQYILETRQTFGAKLLVEPVPITTSLAGSDFGVFNIQANYFSTDGNGNETLLSGVSFPIFFDASFNRLFPSVQEDRMDITGAYGSVTPNFPDFFAGQPYRVTVDLPVQDQIARVFLPAGAIAVPSTVTPSDFCGTVEGAPLPTGDSLEIDLTFPSSITIVAPVTNGAFGIVIGTQQYLSSQPLTVQVVQNHAGTPQVLMTRRVDKGPGGLALDLRVGSDGTYTFAGGLPAGVSSFGLPIDPFASETSDLLGLSTTQFLLARYNQSRAQYDLYPELEAPSIGHGYFVRLDAPLASYVVPGRCIPTIPVSVALKPGWNMVSSPLPESVSTQNIKVIRSTGFPSDYASAAGADIGLDFFTFVPGANDAASGIPETGSMVQATIFDPGKSYFVRVLAPEGVTLVFFPSGVSQPFVSGSPAVSSNSWALRLDLQGLDRTVSARIGVAAKATSRFDARYDSPMPPGIGGFQLSIINGPRMYRDTRELGIAHIFSLQLEGLRPGKTYTLRGLVERGQVEKFALRKGRKDIQLRPGEPFVFNATSSTQTLQLTVRGRSH